VQSMKIVVPPLQFVPGTILCLHVPHGFSYPDKTIDGQILKLASLQGKKAAISKPAGWERKFPLDFSSADWLARVANISLKKSKMIISGIGERLSETVAVKLASNAGTPRCLLGLAATLARDPEIVVYSTIALDPPGIQAVHRFVASRCSHLTAIHISSPSVYGDGSPHPRNCPPVSRCIALTPGSHVSTFVQRIIRWIR